MKKLFAITILALAPMIFGFKLYFTPVSTYVDNSAIEPANLPVLHDFWVGGAPLATGATTSPINLIDNTYGATHTYKGRTRLNDGRVSDNVTVVLQSPFDLRLPKAPAAGWSIGN